MSASDLPDLRRAREGAIILLTLDRPDARNALAEAGKGVVGRKPLVV